ncbi:hypothetical protein ZW61_004139 [Salmonella enterica subsp. houtenae]|uniref:Uncharacterized protein n=2 Tax=Salmonella houtenae TaxID=59205 RepID=A0A5Y6M695_SALHO|nr:hypothetical protein [Salmonella enterica subsp. enterica]EAO9679420.1 hypothetical protein [Salmonella enterica]EBF8286064.1 hypothetical protein [Salmonella enterica subsp. houtenae]EBQ5980779.1 hypothetical protein [Salmonella enterica subsp. houtenae serovar Houten]ECM3642832.1 hypothetical protein [Salmonella enterica subsp. enterica serovar Typhimurium]EDS4965754.1 hypothetical protein [Salmonella enterica subsp. enterica serovar O rough]EHA4050177.1 hypothetical protein [Salmonella 
MSGTSLKYEPTTGELCLTAVGVGDKYYEKNRGNARLPATMLSQEEAELLEEMAAQFGTKKAALIAGLQLLKAHQEE